MIIISRLIWTEEEVKLLKDHYEYSSQEELEKILPRFTMQKIRMKASQLGIKRKVKRNYSKKQKMKRWSKDDTAHLKEIYYTTPNSELEKIFNRQIREINRKAKSLNLIKSDKTIQLDKDNKISAMVGNNEWTQEEEEIVRKYYPTKGQTGVKRLLPNRSSASISTKAERLGVKKNPHASWKQKNIEINNEDIYSITIQYERVDR